MAVKIEVRTSPWNEGEKTIYTDNCVTEELVEKVKEVVKDEKKVHVSFGVTGETLHDILSHQLWNLLPEYNVEIGRYKCVVRL